MQKILSVVIPAYNVEKYLYKCLESLKMPRLMERLEVLVINDGSKDNTREIALEFVRDYPDTYFLYDKENGGHGSTINCGIHYATGKYFKVLDGDDWFDSEVLEAFVELLEKRDEDIVATDFICMQDETYKTLNYMKCTVNQAQYGASEAIDDGNIQSVLKMHMLTFKTELLKAHNITIDENCYYVDMEYVTYPIPYVDKVYFWNKALYMYRIGRKEQSVSVANMQKNCSQHLRVLESLLEFYSANSKLSDAKRQYIEKCISKVVENQFQIYISMGNQKVARLALKEMDKRLRREYPGVYNAVEKVSIAVIRKTGYAILPVAYVVYNILYMINK